MSSQEHDYEAISYERASHISGTESSKFSQMDIPENVITYETEETRDDIVASVRELQKEMKRRQGRDLQQKERELGLRISPSVDECSSATKRVLQDWVELRRNPIRGVSSCPSESNIFEWSANVQGVEGSIYEGGVFHMHVTFSQDYPRRAPKVELLTRVVQSNIFGSWICLDMLEAHDFSYMPYSGWSSCYSIGAVLQQLQVFFCESHECDAYKTAAKERCVGNSLSFVCSRCQHRGRKPYPPFPVVQCIVSAGSEAPTNRKSEPEGHSSEGKKSTRFTRTQKRWSEIPDHIFAHEIFSFLEEMDHMRVQQVSQNFRKWSRFSFDLERARNICYFTRNSFEHCILGTGVDFKFNPHSGDLAYADCMFDLLSYEAFQDNGVRTAIWKRRFTHWIPVFINKDHAKRAFPYLKMITCELYNLERFDPARAIDMLCILMNSQVVNMSSGNLYASEHAISGYGAFYRWMVHVMDEYPPVAEYIENRLKCFVENACHSSNDWLLMKSEPIMGNFLSLLSVSRRYDWSDIGPSYLTELFDRNAKWCLVKYLSLYFDVNDEKRQSSFFISSLVSFRLVMFHVAFYITFRPIKDSLRYFADLVDERFGQPGLTMAGQFQKKIFKIMAVKDFDSFFRMVRVRPMDTLDAILRNSIFHAFRKDFMRPLSRKALYEIRKKQKAQEKNALKMALKMAENRRRTWISDRDTTEDDKWSPWSRKINGMEELEKQQAKAVNVAKLNLLLEPRDRRWINKRITQWGIKFSSL
mmetsp:Transcript_7555/g.28397  ORF Transcript_7555/g.28397 Transcript_7555/m.28397 type:complete len:756 (-) Transcript_7555:1152-3419(-)|eukprot:CAMPEP_0117444424 /NCGR_PEP_ID=MMETSP0759-20121206/5234_1 /TAXON_ID=63605 /ORGANISM="Percolomonas cosmopolitus, Strain WS" /LENGTH=755 /DNA_ID=CAMNT_0005236491 /DNA_START=101 /DNA_END=2368 /DNA_ORIENTATION=-